MIKSQMLKKKIKWKFSNYQDCDESILLQKLWYFERTLY